jgi:hypothetical protein
MRVNPAKSGPAGLFSAGCAEMKARLIFISHRGLRFNSGTNFGGDCRDDQSCHRKERYRGFIYVIIHDNLHSSRNAKPSFL